MQTEQFATKRCCQLPHNVRILVLLQDIQFMAVDDSVNQLFEAERIQEKHCIMMKVTICFSIALTKLFIGYV